MKRKLGDIIILFDNLRHPLSTLEREKRRGDYPYYSANGIIDYVDDYIYDGKYLLMAEDGTVLIDNKYPVIFEVDSKFWVSNHAHVFRANEDIVKQRFLYYFLKNTNITSKILVPCSLNLARRI